MQKQRPSLYAELTLTLCNYTRSDVESAALRIGKASK